MQHPQVCSGASWLLLLASDLTAEFCYMGGRSFTSLRVPQAELGFRKALLQCLSFRFVFSNCQSSGSTGASKRLSCALCSRTEHRMRCQLREQRTVQDSPGHRWARADSSQLIEESDTDETIRQHPGAVRCRATQQGQTAVGRWQWRGTHPFAGRRDSACATARWIGCEP